MSELNNDNSAFNTAMAMPIGSLITAYGSWNWTKEEKLALAHRLRSQLDDLIKRG